MSTDFSLDVEVSGVDMFSIAFVLRRLLLLLSLLLHILSTYDGTFCVRSNGSRKY